MIDKMQKGEQLISFNVGEILMMAPQLPIYQLKKLV